MQQVQQKIELFHGLYLICLILGLVCAAVAIFFFFRFDIWNIFNIQTGRSVKKTIKKMEAFYAGAEAEGSELSAFHSPKNLTDDLETELLRSAPMGDDLQSVDTGDGAFFPEYSIMLVHTEERI